MRRWATRTRAASQAIGAAATLGLVALGCNGLLGIRPALDEEWDGGTLADGAPAAVTQSSSASMSTTSGAASSSAVSFPDSGAVAHWANWPMPNPPSITPALPNQQNYDTSNPGIVIDNVTHLQWDATSDPNLYTFADAVGHCAALSTAGGGWRLPSRIELLSIVDTTQAPARIDSLAFNMPTSDAGILTYWSASPLAGNNGNAWIVDFGTYTNLVLTAQIQPTPANPLVVKYYARCVRGP